MKLSELIEEKLSRKILGVSALGSCSYVKSQKLEKIFEFSMFCKNAAVNFRADIYCQYSQKNGNIVEL